MARHTGKNWSAASGCDGKVRFDSYQQADEVNTARKKSRGNSRRGVYSCPACHGFHLGKRSSLKPGQKAAARRDDERDRLDEIDIEELET
jgi:hypothetical protein